MIKYAAIARSVEKDTLEQAELAQAQAREWTVGIETPKVKAVISLKHLDRIRWAVDWALRQAEMDAMNAASEDEEDENCLRMRKLRKLKRYLE